MANKELGEQALVIGARTFIARVTTNACCELEDFAPGKNWDLLRIGASAGNRKDLRLFFWTILRSRHPEVATTQPSCLTVIGDLIDLAGGGDSVALMKWITQFIELNKELEGQNDQPKGASKAQDPLDAQPETVGVDSVLTPASLA